MTAADFGPIQMYLGCLVSVAYHLNKRGNTGMIILCLLFCPCEFSE